MGLANQLLSWYDENRRELPWRQDKEAYKIWVSEIMLQQTRVEAVKEYYRRWLERFPTLEALAEASEQEVLNYWQGLGYYNRARNLQKGVREVLASYAGRIPDDEQGIRNLPGIGEYTAGAILSISYGKKTPAIDGNVTRIFSRLFCIADDVNKASTKRTIYRLVKEHISNQRPGDFNQALMDLGSMVCVPKRPRCKECPLSNLCQAYALEAEATLPVKPSKQEPVPVTLAAAIVSRGKECLVCLRPAKGLLANMWEFPTVEIPDGQDAMNSLHSFLQQGLGLEVEIGDKCSQFIHTFSHRRWDISFYTCRWLGGVKLPDQAKWMPLSRFSELPWAGPHQKVSKVMANCAEL